METYKDILDRMKRAYQEESGHCAEDVSDTGLRLRVMAGELHRLRAEIVWVERQAFPHTAQGEWLDRHGAMRGVTRREAERAKGTLVFSRYLPLSFDVVIPAGTVCASSGEEPVEYETTEPGVLSAGQLTVEVPARAVLGGPGGNIDAGYVNTLPSPPSGVNYVTNTKPFSGGRGRESDEEYRARVLCAYADLPNGTNAAYYADIAGSVEGVGSVGVVPRESGVGTAGVYLWGVDGAPSEAVIARVAAEISRRREIGVDVSVRAAVGKTVNVSAQVKLRDGADLTLAKASAEQALAQFFAGLTVGSPVYLIDLERVLLEAMPLSRIKFPLSMQDLDASPSVIPLLGTVTLEELE